MHLGKGKLDRGAVIGGFIGAGVTNPFLLEAAGGVRRICN